MCEYTQLAQWLHINSFILPRATAARRPAGISSTVGPFFFFFYVLWQTHNSNRFFSLLTRQKMHASLFHTIKKIMCEKTTFWQVWRPVHTLLHQTSVQRQRAATRGAAETIKDGSLANESVLRNDSLTQTNWFHVSILSRSFFRFSQTSRCVVHCLVIRVAKRTESRPIVCWAEDTVVEF